MIKIDPRAIVSAIGISLKNIANDRYTNVGKLLEKHIVMMLFMA